MHKKDESEHYRTLLSQLDFYNLDQQFHRNNCV